MAEHKRLLALEDLWLEQMSRFEVATLVELGFRRFAALREKYQRHLDREAA